jgi:hypothetical protein
MVASEALDGVSEFSLYSRTAGVAVERLGEAIYRMNAGYKLISDASPSLFFRFI